MRCSSRDDIVRAIERTGRSAAAAGNGVSCSPIVVIRELFIRGAAHRYRVVNSSTCTARYSVIEGEVSACAGRKAGELPSRSWGSGGTSKRRARILT